MEKEILRTCNECAETKPLSFYSANKDAPNGYRIICKKCVTD